MRITFLINPQTKQAVKVEKESYDGDWMAKYPHLKGCDYVDGDTCYNQIGTVWYAEELANINGMYFTLYQESHHTSEDIEKAKSYLRRERDCVKIVVKKVVAA